MSSCPEELNSLTLCDSHNHEGLDPAHKQIHELLNRKHDEVPLEEQAVKGMDTYGCRVEQEL